MTIRGHVAIAAILGSGALGAAALFGYRAGASAQAGAQRASEQRIADLDSKVRGLGAAVQALDSRLEQALSPRFQLLGSAEPGPQSARGPWAPILAVGGAGGPNHSAEEHVPPFGAPRSRTGRSLKW